LKISKIILYDEDTVPEIHLDRLEEFLADTFPIKIETRKDILRNLDGKIYEKFASIEIFDMKKPFQKHNSSVKEIQNERDSVDLSQEKMPLYDGIEFQRIVSELIPHNENRIDILNVVFTDKLTCTFDESDFRYHGRSMIASNPTIISTTGMIEAPAKPKQYYLELMTGFSKERIDEIKKKYEGQFLEYHDSRLSDIAEGYLLQTIMYYETGEAFCENMDCRCFNAHWQKDLFRSQVDNKKFCKKHEEILNQFKQN